jgi:hypothetical protein
MGSSRTTFEKQQRDRAKKAKAAAKRERRQGRAAGDEPGYRPAAPVAPVAGLTSAAAIQGEVSAEQLLVLVENLHRRFDAGEITLDEFEEEKAHLFSLLTVD